MEMLVNELKKQKANIKQMEYDQKIVNEKYESDIKRLKDKAQLKIKQLQETFTNDINRLKNARTAANNNTKKQQNNQIAASNHTASAIRLLETNLSKTNSQLLTSNATITKLRNEIAYLNKQLEKINVKLLHQLGQELNFVAHGTASVSLDGETVSSTRIRQAIAGGQLDLAGQMLGREYALAGKVIRGDQRGRELGFPTANLEITGRCTPPNGVYAAHAEVDGKPYRDAVNIGLRPTLKDPEPVLHVEAYLLDFDGEIYDRVCTLTFVGKLREEQSFDSLDGLRAQIEKDVVQARYLFTQL